MRIDAPFLALFLLGVTLSGCHSDPQPPHDGGTDAGSCQSIPADAGLPATLRFTADNQRAVYLNGVELENSTKAWNTITTLPITLSRNPTVPNLIAVRGTNTSSQGGEDRGIILDIAWTLADGGTPLSDGGTYLVISDSQWKVAADGPDAGPDGGLAWTLPDFDDSSWASAVDEGANGVAPWGALMGSSPARWIWLYNSGSVAVGVKPDLENAYFRRVFYVGADGLPSPAPGACPP